MYIIYTALCMCTVPHAKTIYNFTGMGFGIQFSRSQRQSQSSGAVLGSTDASGNSSSAESTPGEEEGDGTRVALYRAIYTFVATNEDEVHVYHSNIYRRVVGDNREFENHHY